MKTIKTAKATGKILAFLVAKIEISRLDADAARVQPAPQQATTYRWTEEDPTFTPDTYASECGELWSFIDGGVLENKVKFCHGCGKRLVVVPQGNENDL